MLHLAKARAIASKPALPRAVEWMDGEAASSHREP